MNNKKTAALEVRLLASSAILIGSMLFSAAHGFSDPTTTGGQGCQACHNAGVIPQISITGPTQVPIDSTHTLTLVITGGPAVVGGMNVAADAGILAADDPLTEITDGEVTHSSPKDFSGDTVSWDFIWTAPSIPGSVDLFAAGVSANDAMGSGGDFEGTTVFNIQVVPLPATGLLLASGLALLGWLRRRAE